MKLTKQVLEQIIKEEIESVLLENLQPKDCDCRIPAGSVYIDKGGALVDSTVPSWAKPKPGSKWCPAPEYLYKQGAVGCNPHTGRWEADIDSPRGRRTGRDEPNYKYQGKYGCTDCLEERELIKKLLNMRKAFGLDLENNQKVVDEINDLIYYLTGGMPLRKGLLAAWGYCKGHKRIVSLINRAHKRFVEKKGSPKRLIRFAHMKICKLPELSNIRKKAKAWGRPRIAQKSKCSREEYRKAFRAARRAGKKRFEFCGKVYSTALKK